MSIPNLPEYFGRWSYPDIAVAHDIGIDDSRKLYYAGVQKGIRRVYFIGLDDVWRLSWPFYMEKVNCGDAHPMLVELFTKKLSFYF